MGLLLTKYWHLYSSEDAEYLTKKWCSCDDMDERSERTAKKQRIGVKEP